jgi:hypothetical protein
VGVTALLAVATIAIVAAVSSQRTEPSQRPLPSAVLELLPGEGTVALRQSPIGATLRSEFTGTVAVDGRDVPLDERTVDEMGTSRRVTFTPGHNRVITTLRPGAHTATVYWWSITEPNPDDYARASAFTWSFTVE